MQIRNLSSCMMYIMKIEDVASNRCLHLNYLGENHKLVNHPILRAGLFEFFTPALLLH